MYTDKDLVTNQLERERSGIRNTSTSKTAIKESNATKYSVRDYAKEQLMRKRKGIRNSAAVKGFLDGYNAPSEAIRKMTGFSDSVQSKINNYKDQKELVLSDPKIKSAKITNNSTTVSYDTSDLSDAKVHKVTSYKDGSSKEIFVSKDGKKKTVIMRDQYNEATSKTVYGGVNSLSRNLSEYCHDRKVKNAAKAYNERKEKEAFKQEIKQQEELHKWKNLSGGMKVGRVGKNAGKGVKTAGKVGGKAARGGAKGLKMGNEAMQRGLEFNAVEYAVEKTKQAAARKAKKEASKKVREAFHAAIKGMMKMAIRMLCWIVGLIVAMFTYMLPVAIILLIILLVIVFVMMLFSSSYGRYKPTHPFPNMVDNENYYETYFYRELSSSYNLMKYNLYNENLSAAETYLTYPTIWKNEYEDYRWGLSFYDKALEACKALYLFESYDLDAMAEAKADGDNSDCPWFIIDTDEERARANKIIGYMVSYNVNDTEWSVSFTPPGKYYNEFNLSTEDFPEELIPLTGCPVRIERYFTMPDDINYSLLPLEQRKIIGAANQYLNYACALDEEPGGEYISQLKFLEKTFRDAGRITYISQPPLYWNPLEGAYSLDTWYNSCEIVDSPQPGDIVFFQNTYTSPFAVTEAGIYAGNNYMIYAGSSCVHYVKIDTQYWKDHFYAYGRLKSR